MTREQKVALRFFLQQYPDDKLAALLAHAQDGKLAYHCCCCFIGVINAPHALQTSGSFLPQEGPVHHNEARLLPGGFEAEMAFRGLGNDSDRRRLIIPLIRAEFWRRERAARRMPAGAASPVPVPARELATALR